MARSTRKRRDSGPPTASSLSSRSTSRSKRSKGSTSKKYEMKFASMEFVFAVGDLENEEDRYRFWVGRLQEDVLMGNANDGTTEACVDIEWFDVIEVENEELIRDDKNVYYISRKIESTPIGSLVCSISPYIVSECKTSETENENEVEVTVSPEAFVYGRRKLQEQLEDDYLSETDSQFGDEAVTKRLSGGLRSNRMCQHLKFDNDNDNDGNEEKKGTKRKQMSVAKGKKRSKGGKNALTPRPNVNVVDDPFLKKTGYLYDFQGDRERASKEVIRAVKSNDWKALNVLLKTKRSGLWSRQCIDLPLTALQWAMILGNVKMVDLLLSRLTKNNENGENVEEMQRCELSAFGTGHQTSRFASTHHRRIHASRGGREGTNALLYDTDPRSSDGYAHVRNVNLKSLFVKFQPYGLNPDKWERNVFVDFDPIPNEVWDMAEAKYSLVVSVDWTDQMLEGGQVDVLKRTIQRQRDHVYAGVEGSFNLFHLEALGSDTVLGEQPFSKKPLSKNVIKMTQTESRFSPLACACINPCTIYLKALLTVAPEHVSTVDQNETTLMHYAAACVTKDSLVYLSEHFSLSCVSSNKRKELPIHFAARAARPDNVKFLLESFGNLEARTLAGYTALHLATNSMRALSLETMKVLLEAGADPNAPGRFQKLTPMHLASRVGDWLKMKLLHDYGGDWCGSDGLGRSPLVHACKNGMAHVVSYLLREGVPFQEDASENGAMHYAAAYGWDECVDLLVTAGADPNATNAWKMVPLTVAMAKGRYRMVSKLLDVPRVNVNVKDFQTGTPFLFRFLESFRDELRGEVPLPALPENPEKRRQAVQKRLPHSLQTLLKRKDLDFAIRDETGRTFCHLLCAPHYQWEVSQDYVVALWQLCSVDVNATDSKGRTPLLEAARADNFVLFQYLLTRTTAPGSVDQEGKNVCHYLLRRKTPAKVWERLEEVEGFASMLEVRDHLGFCPLHYTVQELWECETKEFDFMVGRIQSLVTRYPCLAVHTVGPVAVFRDARRLASVLCDERFVDEVFPEDWDPSRIRQALPSYRTVVPLESEHVHKTILHFVCEVTPTNGHVSKIANLLQWLVPLSKSCLGWSGGRGNLAMTPLEICLRRTLCHCVPSQVSFVWEWVTLLIGHGAKVEEKRLVPEEEQSWTKEADRVAVETLLTTAKEFLVTSDPVVGGTVVEQFGALMESRRMQQEVLPLVIVWAKEGSFGVEGWKRVSEREWNWTLTDRKGESALMYALRRRDVALVTFMCAHCPKLLEMANDEGEYPIHVVAKLDHGELMKLVLKGGDVNRRDGKGRTALHWSVQTAKKRSVSVLEPCEWLLLQAGARVDVVDTMHRTPLHYCFGEHSDDLIYLKKNDDPVDLVSTLLSGEGASESVTLTDCKGRTALGYAAATNATVSSLLLRSKGADLFHVDDEGNTPLTTAILRGWDTYAITLLTTASSVTFTDCVLRQTKRSMLWHALQFPSQGLVHVLLQAKFPVPQAVQDALAVGSLALVRKLLAENPDVCRHVFPGGRTVLHEMADSKLELSTLARWVVERGGVSISQKANDGQTALHLAATNAQYALAQFLVEQDPTCVRTVDKEGCVPLGRFLKNVAKHQLSEADGRQLFSLLTTGMETLDKFHRVPISQNDKSWADPHESEISLVPGPNWDTERQRMERELEPFKEESDVATGYSTLLIQALYARRPTLVQALLDRGADVNQLDSQGLAPLHHAVLLGSVEDAVVLLRHASIDVDCLGTPRAITPLILLTWLNSDKTTTLAMANVLLRNCANVTIQCQKPLGGTALHYACRHNRMDLAELLLRAALHSQVSLPPPPKLAPTSDRPCLVRFGHDGALYFGKMLEGMDTIRVFYPQVTHVSMSLAHVHVYDGSELSLLNFKEEKCSQLDDNQTVYTVGSRIILQEGRTNADGNVYANQQQPWFEGTVTTVHNNGTYDVDLFRGRFLTAVIPQRMRPWNHSDFQWPLSVSQSPVLTSLLALRDERGHTPLQAVVKPVSFGSFENVELAQRLVKYGAVVDSETVQMTRPYSDLRRYLQSVPLQSSSQSHSTNGDGTTAMEVETSEPPPDTDWEPISAEQLEADARAGLLALETKKSYKTPKAQINAVCELRGVSLRVLPVPEGSGTKSLFYDVVMTKVEMTHDGYSNNVFYKMQIVEDCVSRIFVLVTNWGRIGEYGGGKKQETPFFSEAEAVKAFGKLFQTKTGNSWESFQNSSFRPLLVKYKPVQLLGSDYETPELPDILRSDDQSLPPSALSEDVARLMTLWVNPRLMGEAARHLGLFQDKLPLGQLSMDTILQAETKLGEVEAALRDVDTTDLAKKREALERVAVASSQYFEMLPTREGDQALGPLDAHSIQDQYRILVGLKPLTVASRIVTAATVRTNHAHVHPLDYAYRALDASIRRISPDTPERGGIEQYFRQTNHSHSDLVIRDVYAIQRAHDHPHFVEMSNRRLLWHGTPAANLMGVLKEGLRVAPVTAQVSGNAFGDGVYFADTVAKSWPYCRGFQKETVDDDDCMPKAYLLLADVALGTQEIVSTSHPKSNQGSDNADSRWVVGYEGPDSQQDLVFADSGIRVPLGTCKKRPEGPPKATWKPTRGHPLTDTANEAVEAVRNALDTTFPARVPIQYRDRDMEVILEQGPFPTTAKVVPLPHKEESTNDDFYIARREEPVRNHVRYSEYVVRDPQRIRLRYVVEVTSLEWIQAQFRKEKRIQTQERKDNGTKHTLGTDSVDDESIDDTNIL